VTSALAAGGSVEAESALAIKANEARRLGSGGHGVVLVLAARARQLLPAAEYERQMRAELRAAAERLPVTWPLLWCPGPAEVGLLPAGAPKRPAWAMPRACGPSALLGWLRYLLAVRPAAPAA